MNYNIIILFCLFLFSCKSIKQTNSVNNYYEQPCSLYKAQFAVKLEFVELKSQLADFYESRFTYDLILIEKISGKGNTGIFKRLSQDPLGNVVITRDYTSEPKAVQSENNEYINQLINNIEEGHYYDECKGFSSLAKTYILLVKVNHKIRFSFLLSNNSLESYSNEDKIKLKDGYELARILEEL